MGSVVGVAAGAAAGVRQGGAAAALGPAGLPVLAAALTYALLLALGGRLLADPDTYWHVATGRWIVEHGRVPTADPFSHTFAGQPWIAHEWLAEVVLAAAHGWLGWGGVVALTALAAAVALGLLAHALGRWLPPGHVVAASALSLALVAPHLLARPHALAMPFLVAWAAGLVRARAEGRPPSPWLLPLMVAWANLHGGFAVGVALCALLGAEAVIEAPAARRAREARGWVGFACLAVLAAAATPNGLAGLTFPFHMLSMGDALAAALDEWRGPDMRGFGAFQLSIMLLVVAGLGLGVRLTLPRALMLALLLHMAFQHVRHAELLGLLGPLLAAPALGCRLAPAARPPGLPVRTLAAVAALAAALQVPAALALGRAGVGPPARITPAAAVAAAAGAGADGPVLNAYGFGGYLIFRGIPPSIDGRADMYGGRVLGDHVRMVGGDGRLLEASLARHGIGWTLFPPGAPVTGVLNRLPGWRRVHADDVAVVHVRDGPRPAPPRGG
jgi:hypothetical protein